MKPKKPQAVEKEAVASEEEEEEEDSTEAKWNNLQLRAVEHLKIPRLSITVRQAVWVIGCNSKLAPSSKNKPTPKIYQGVVARKTANIRDSWDVEFSGEKDSFHYPAWAIFKSIGVARQVVQAMVDML